MFVCNCNGITETEIRGAVALGCSTVGDLQGALGVASCCGKCLPDVRRVLVGCAACPGQAARRAAGD